MVYRSYGINMPDEALNKQEKENGYAQRQIYC